MQNENVGPLGQKAGWWGGMAFSFLMCALSLSLCVCMSVSISVTPYHGFFFCYLMSAPLDMGILTG